MMLLKPTLRICELLVKRNAHAAFSASFHGGVNIISGQNSAGKTTILDFLAYSLGANQDNWKPEALLCTDVFVEIEANGTPMTLWRPVSSSSKNPMNIFWGRLTAAAKAPFTEWSQYGYAKSASRESFSQVLFRALGLPELRGEANSNITMHQLLRLLYVDQRSLHSAIFRNDTFDNALIREAVGNYLCGIYDEQIYNTELRVRIVETELSRSVADLKSIFTVLGRAGQETNFEWVGSEIGVLEHREGELLQKLKDLRGSNSTADQRDPGVSKLRIRLSEIKGELARAEDEKRSLELELTDSGLFLAEIQRRVQALENSQEARNYLGSIKFNFCPCCLNKLPLEEEKDSCYLCKSPTVDAMPVSQLARMKNELELQQKESTRLIALRKSRLEELGISIPSIRSSLRSLEREYFAQTQTWTSSIESQVDVLNREIGEVRQRSKQLLDAQKLGSTILQLQERRTALAAEAEELRSLLELLSSAQQARQDEAKLAIATELVSLLHQDLPRQEQFVAAEVADWSFSENRVSVNGFTEFSESSMVLLRHCFHLALLVASTKHPFFRIPRFVLLDGIDDGGLELDRNHNFQNLIVEVSKNLQAEHQIIFATSQISPALNTEDLVIGRTFATANKSLSLN